MQHAKAIALAVIPALIMIGLIATLRDEVLVSGLFVVIIAISLAVHYERHDWIFILIGFFIYPVFEYLFVSTGLEVFSERGLLGVMPLWMPLLWAWGAVAIKRVLHHFDVMFG